ncbi:hypothetical protein PPL_02252 [Heterostelium album PN500]|uniref:Calponin-homology (CH) domain-containing protein n=1 Tax=Heterostelium pallidum (strain ATCC 26659 / Pp 5 / PN500) TaxID=670386 RepID=D3B1S8_HETP5|nr:hypothetical protein PPL_02252 [Heterostelium album PN500]EFA85252.1 hypothetical protein PPL_02252 [Heterostelium album PN500]|eukprot:XP_020437361.1 hypothetical protein PPL_02252 [Heterostelium album PN500]
MSSRPTRPGGKKPSAGSVTITMSDFQTYEMQSRSAECRKWIEQIVGEEIDKDMHVALKDGVVLCKLANIIFPNIIPRYNKSQITFKLIENINSFIAVVKRLGINEHQIFIATDLIENKNIQKSAPSQSASSSANNTPTRAGTAGRSNSVFSPPKSNILSPSPSSSSNTTNNNSNSNSNVISNGNGSQNGITNSPYRSNSLSSGSGQSAKPNILPGSPIYSNPVPASQQVADSPKTSSISQQTTATATINTSSPSPPSHTPTTTVTTTAAAIPPTQSVLEQKMEKYHKLASESKESVSPLHFAVREADVDAVNHLTKYSKAVTVYGRTPLHFAVSSQRPELITILTDAGGDVNAPDKDGNTPLHLALLHGDFLTIESLVKHGADVNAVNNDDSTPIMMVSLNGDERIVDLLLGAGANVKSANKKGNTALHYATLRGHKRVVDKLLEAGSDVNAVNMDGATSLHVAAEENFAGIAESLANSGAAVDSQRLDGWTPLYTAAYKGNLETAKSLLEKGARVDDINLDGWTPLHAACAEGHLEVAQMLIQVGKADVNKQDSQGTTPLYHSCAFGSLELTKYLLEQKADPELSKPGGWKPIHIACYNENDAITRHLVDESVDLNAGNNEIKGYAPIHILISTEEPRLAIIELLLKKKIDINKKNVNGSTPLHLAVFWNHFKVLELLLRYNASLEEKNNKGRTPLSLACHYGNEEVARFLAEKMQIDPRKLKIKNNKQKILDMETPSAPPAPQN